MSTIIPQSLTGPLATGNLVGSPVLNLHTTLSTFLPRTEISGPHIPASVRCAVPFGRIRSSAVWTWVWVPTTADTVPSRWKPMAMLSLVVSAWKSRKIILTSCSSLRRLTSFSTTVKGFSSGGFMKVLPCALRIAIFPNSVSRVTDPLPGVLGG